MMRSMTGFGAGRAGSKTVQVSVELRGVNQRHLDVKVTAPREYVVWETEVRDAVRATVERGRVEVAIARTLAGGGKRGAVRARDELALAYVAEARRLARRLGLEDRVAITDVLRLPDLFETGVPAPDLAAERPLVQRALKAALKAFVAEREREGRRLAKDMLGRVAAVRQAVTRVQRRIPVVQDGLRSAARERIARLAADLPLDAGRLAHEVALLAEKADISEELVRLDSHLDALDAALRGAHGAGKRVEFLLQEVHRELNTSGVKAQDLRITDDIVAAKTEIEKLREQVQNVE